MATTRRAGVRATTGRLMKPADLATQQKRGQLARLVAETEAQIRAAVQDARGDVAPVLAAFAKAYADELARVNADRDDEDDPPAKVPLHWLLASGWGKRVKHALGDAAHRIGQQSYAVVRQGVRQTARMGDADAKALVERAVAPLLDALRRRYAQISGDLSGGGALWNYVPVSASQALQENVGQYSLLFNTFGGDATNGAEFLLNLGLTGGQGPQALAGQLADLLYSSQSRGLTIARTEMLGAYRDAQLDNYRANADVVDQWMWSADKAGCCPMCLVQDGQLFPIDADMDSHVNCACSPVPVTKPWGDILGPLGISAEGLDDTRITASYESGMDWLARQPDYAQRIILGPANFGAWKSGDMQLTDLVGQRDDGQYYLRSLREQGLNAGDYLGRNAPELHDVPMPEEAPVVRDASKFIHPDDVAAWTAGNAEGVPDIGYHAGTPEHIARLEREGVDVTRGNRNAFYGQGFYMYPTPDGAYARMALGPDAEQIQVAVHMQNPLVIDASDPERRMSAVAGRMFAEHPEWRLDEEHFPEHLTAWAREQGYDGIIGTGGDAAKAINPALRDEIVAIEPGSVRVLDENAARLELGANAPELRDVPVAAEPVTMVKQPDMDIRTIKYEDVPAFTSVNPPEVPPLLYHVTNEAGERALLERGIDYEPATGQRLADQGRGFYMTPLPFKPYLQYGNDRIVTVATSIEKPWIFEGAEWNAYQTQLIREHGAEWDAALQAELERQGYDAIIVKANFAYQSDYGWDFVISKEPGQVRIVTDAPEPPPGVDGSNYARVKPELEAYQQRLAELKAGEAAQAVEPVGPSLGTVGEIPSALAETPYAGPTDAYEREVADNLEPRIAQYAALHPEMTVDEYKAAVEANLRDLVGGDVTASVRVPSVTLDKILDDGRLKTSHEVGKLGETEALRQVYNDYRVQFEREAFGYAADAPVEARPISGYLTDAGTDSKFAMMYGDARLVLTDDAQQRMTVTFGDSLDNGEAGSELIVPHPLSGLSWNSFSYPASDDPAAEWIAADPAGYQAMLRARDPLNWASVRDYASANGPYSDAYVEVQVHGGVGVSDISRVEFTGDTPPDPALTQRLDDAGITWTYEPRSRYVDTGSTGE